ncbi:MAG: divalent-cation tolerance protein CutA [Ilumatobacter sp.]|nr:divalent-cation tolerance protein CutA [Ilumatobacter sp.]
MRDMERQVVEMQITCGSEAEATTIADALVERRLAACVQALPIRSTYRWQGAIERDDELLLLVKTVAARIDDVCATVHELHSYDVPALTVVEVAGGSDDYLDWVRTETS